MLFCKIKLFLCKCVQCYTCILWPIYHKPIYSNIIFYFNYCYCQRKFFDHTFKNLQEKTYTSCDSHLTSLLCYKGLFVFGSHIMYFANVAGGINGYFYYVNFVGNSNYCQIEGLQENIKNAIFNSVSNNRWVIYRNIVPLKQRFFPPSFHYICTKIYEFFGGLCPAMTRCKWKKWLYLAISLIRNCILAAILNFGTFPRTVFWVVPDKVSLLRIYSISKTNVPGLYANQWTKYTIYSL